MTGFELREGLMEIINLGLGIKTMTWAGIYEEDFRSHTIAILIAITGFQLIGGNGFCVYWPSDVMLCYV